MARDPLSTLHAVRQRTVEQARQALGACLTAEAEVMDRIRMLDDAGRRDREAVGTVNDDHQFMDMFAVRRETIRTDRRTAVADLVAMEGRSTEARATVAAARTAAEAVEQLIGERAAAERFEAARREQHELDDIVRRRQAARPGA